MEKKFKNKILVVGFGSVGQCTLPILFKHINIPYDHVTVMDFEDKQTQLQPWIDRGVQYVRDKLNQELMASQLEKYLHAGDILIDLAWNIGADAVAGTSRCRARPCTDSCCKRRRWIDE